MARPLRIDYPGAWHHVMSRGARRAPIFRSDVECSLFLSVLAELPKRYGVEVHAYALMPNHYHLLVRSRLGHLSRAMRHVNGVFTQKANEMARHDGPLFRGRFHSRLVRGDAHLLTVASYIHLNPVRAHLVRRVDQRAWTSHRAYVGLEAAPDWLERRVLLDLAGGAERFDEMVRDYRTGARAWPTWLDVERGVITYEDELPAPPPAATTSRAEVQRLIARLLKLCDASPSDLKKSQFGPRGNPVRRFAAWALMMSTELTQAQVGQHLGLTANHVARLYASVGREAGPPVAVWREAWLNEAGKS